MRFWPQKRRIGMVISMWKMKLGVLTLHWPFVRCCHWTKLRETICWVTSGLSCGKIDQSSTKLKTLLRVLRRMQSLRLCLWCQTLIHDLTSSQCSLEHARWTLISGYSTLRSIKQTSTRSSSCISLRCWLVQNSGTSITKLFCPVGSSRSWMNMYSES